MQAPGPMNVSSPEFWTPAIRVRSILDSEVI